MDKITKNAQIDGQSKITLNVNYGNSILPRHNSVGDDRVYNIQYMKGFYSCIL